MSQGKSCDCGREHIRVKHRRHKHSATLQQQQTLGVIFNGYHKTHSDYSEVVCIHCLRSWRTKAQWVDSCPGLRKGEYDNYPDFKECV